MHWEELSPSAKLAANSLLSPNCIRKLITTAMLPRKLAQAAKRMGLYGGVHQPD